MIGFEAVVLGTLLFSVVQGLDDASIRDDIEMASNDAKHFNVPLSRSRRGLHHECYDEGCSFEEVDEVLGRSKAAYEYYYTYTCDTFRRNCKVRCTYRHDCSFGNWGSWSKYGKQNSQCYSQRRYKPYHHQQQVLYKRWNCNSLHTTCPSTPYEQRLLCVCRKANCRAGTWSVWGGTPPQGKCVTQSRQKPYHVTFTYEQQVGSCSGIPSRCPSPDIDLRRRCSCKRAVCSLNNWSSWQGAVSQGACGSQRRTLSYAIRVVYEEHNDCSAVPQQCPAQKTETRTFCNCKYATCKLGGWSEWNPNKLQQGPCGQRQTRRKSYALTWAYQNYVETCPSLPQKCPADVVESRQQCMCAYRDSCDLHDWTAWTADVTEEGCKVQTRRRTYVHPLKHVQKKNCDGLNTECHVEPTESRTYCKCKTVKCMLGAWSNWNGSDITTGTCEEQLRTKSYGVEVIYTNRVGNCDGLQTTCPADVTETRTMCKCSAVLCSVGDWGEWQGNIPADTCNIQTRIKSVNTTNIHKYKANTCESLQTKCPAASEESRKMCNCSYREDCTLKEWGAWSGVVPDVGCALQIRTRQYNNSIIYIKKESCDGLTGCAAIRDDTRTKCNCNQIICAWGNWFREKFDPATNCYTETRVKNISSGFKKIERMENCNGISTQCGHNTVERRKDCHSGGGSQIFTSPPPTPAVTTVPPTTPFVPATYVKIGCFADDPEKQPRPLPHLYLNLRDKITDWYNMNPIIQGCANKARELRYEYFGLQFFGECWSGVNARTTFTRDGISKNCWNGVGAKRTNFVYRLESMPACSKEVDFTTKVSSGHVSSDSTWCAGDADKYQWITVNLNNAKKITGIGTQGGSKDSWVTLYSLEYSEEGEAWIPYKETEEPKVFSGNSDRFTLETYWLNKPLNAQYLKFKPRSWTSTHVCMKIRVYGCDV